MGSGSGDLEAWICSPDFRARQASATSRSRFSRTA